jgi:hypothetical protein
MNAPKKVFYFEAQGGLVRETLPSVSNFFQYEIPDTPENRHFIEAGLKSARLEGCQLVYAQSFIDALNKRFGPRGV